METIDSIKTKLNSLGNTAKISNFDISAPEYISQLDYNCEGVTFINCNFQSRVIFEGIDLKLGLQFINCKFDSRAAIIKCSAKGYNMNFNPNNDSISFNNCEFNDILDISDCKLEREIKLNECKKLAKLSLINNEASGIDILSSLVENIFAYSGNHLEGLINFNKSTINESLKLDGNYCTYLFLIDATFKSDVWIYGGQATAGITLNRGIYEDSFKMEAVNSTGTLTLVDTDFRKSSVILYHDAKNNTNGGCPKIYITSCRFTSGFLLQGHPKGRAQIIESIEILSTNNLSGFLKVEGFNVNNLSLQGINSNCIISFELILVKSLKLLNYSNFSTTQFFGVEADGKKDSKLEIIDSFLGKTHFSTINFKTFYKIDIDRSILTEITATYVSWFNKEQIESSRLKISYYSAQKIGYEIAKNELNQEIFRQLKFAMEKQGDRIQYLKFRELEIESYRQVIKRKNNKLNQDRLILWLGLTNQHGQDWFRPVWMACISLFLFTLLIIISQSDQLKWTVSLDFVSIKNTLIIYCNNLFIFWHLLNPTHNIDVLGKIKGWTLFWDFLSRLFLAFFIYQTISAFRKFSK
jgi:hypothetical protein